MISFNFKVNKSFLDNRSHPITIPKSEVDYEKIKNLNVESSPVTIICHDSSKLSGKIYRGVAGYGLYYQIRMNGYAGDPLYEIGLGKKLNVQIQKNHEDLEPIHK